MTPEKLPLSVEQRPIQSTCCHAEIEVYSAHEGTSHYVCLKCRRACDTQIVEQK